MPNNEEIGKQASIDGFAHEHIVVGFFNETLPKCFIG